LVAGCRAASTRPKQSRIVVLSVTCKAKRERQPHPAPRVPKLIWFFKFSKSCVLFPLVKSSNSVNVSYVSRFKTSSLIILLVKTRQNCGRACSACRTLPLLRVPNSVRLCPSLSVSEILLILRIIICSDVSKRRSPHSEITPLPPGPQE